MVTAKITQKQNKKINHKKINYAKISFIFLWFLIIICSSIGLILFNIKIDWEQTKQNNLIQWLLDNPTLAEEDFWKQGLEIIIGYNDINIYYFYYFYIFLLINLVIGLLGFCWSVVFPFDKLLSKTKKI